LDQLLGCHKGILGENPEIFPPRGHRPPREGLRNLGRGNDRGRLQGLEGRLIATHVDDMEEPVSPGGLETMKPLGFLLPGTHKIGRARAIGTLHDETVTSRPPGGSG